MSQGRFLRMLTLAGWAAALGASGSNACAGTFTTLYQFTGGTDGKQPASSVLQDSSGTFYGETVEGGSTDCIPEVGGPPSFVGCGTLYSFSRSTGIKPLVVFNGPNGAYGKSSPTLIGSTLYASASQGGLANNGVLFSIKTNGSGFKVIHQFVGSDGSGPTGSLVAGPDHVLYGVASAGGPTFPEKAYGVLFKLSMDGKYTILHSFNNGVGGGFPNSIVVEKSGLIIGTTFTGGNTGPLCGSGGCGVLYSFNPSIGKFTLLHTFLNGSGQGGYQPVLGSIGLDGTFYGNAQPFFSIGPKGFALLPATSFIGYGLGSDADVAPTLGPNGSLTSVQQFGTSFGGGGTLFQQIGNVSTVLYNFDDFAGGEEPSAAPLLTPTGSFIGTAAAGGAACSCGTIWEYAP